eukprot:gene6078-6034_t
MALSESQRTGMAMAFSFAAGFVFFKMAGSGGGGGGGGGEYASYPEPAGFVADPNSMQQRGARDVRIQENADLDGNSNINSMSTEPAPTSIDIRVTYESKTATVRLGLSSKDSAVKQAIRLALDLPADRRFGLVATGAAAAAAGSSGDTVVTASMASLAANANYQVRLVPLPCPPPAPPPQQEGVAGAGGGGGSDFVGGGQPGLVLPGGPHGLASQDGTILGEKPARLPRVILTSLGVKFFGGDCEPSFHVLTDDVDTVPSHLNPAYAPYREWPESGLSKFKDILAALGDEMRHADYFFFLDADVRFMEEVNLVDIGADLMGVEHPMYPRYELGWCKPDDPNTRGFCQFPYERKKESKARIPDGHGRYVKEKKFIVSNAYYLQSAFWGGKTEHVIKMFEELIPNIEEDGRNKYYSRILQDERHFNYYFWKHQNDSDINMRILSPSYLYPYHPVGFSDWVTKENRPIVVHGIGKKSGKLIKGATELFCEGTRKCMDLFSGKPIGFYGCHHVADSQGFMFEKTHVIRTASRGVPQCLDATGVQDGSAVQLSDCDENAQGMLWNRLTSLCLDPMVDPKKFPEAAKDMKKAPAGIAACDPSSKYQKFKFREI